MLNWRGSMKTLRKRKAPGMTFLRIPSYLLASFFSLVCLTSFAGAGPAPDATDQHPGQVGTIRFLESYPEGTDLDMPEFAPAAREWARVLAGAEQSIDVASFYFSRLGDGKDKVNAPGVEDQLRPVLAELARAGARGCRVRVLGDSKFYKTYPEVLDEMNSTAGLESRHIDCKKLWGGGVMHAKYFVVDDRTMYLGSQNWDWRAMNQIRELGALVDHAGLAADLKRIFTRDWQSAAQEADPGVPGPGLEFSRLPESWANADAARLVTAAGDTCRAVLAASPAQHNPEGISWDLPILLGLIKSAEKQVRLQLLSYYLADRDGSFWPTLDNALREAAARQVQVQIILSNWSKSRHSAPWLQSLAAVPNIEIKFSNIPENEAGFIPYARVEHPKYLTVDGKLAWIGTSNWSRDYFYQSRNVSLFLSGVGAAGQLDTFFAKGWNGPYTETVDPCGEYQPPRKY
jgi:phosphatidylserine/phosphatidylglycerophosphate/cardiolipin synthase-like enzyme